jgi:hypothetical protein
MEATMPRARGRLHTCCQHLASGVSAALEQQGQPQQPQPPQHRRRQRPQLHPDDDAPAGGLFVADYSRLPTPTNDLARAKSDIDVYGYCIWRDALGREEREAMSRRLVSQALAEEARGGTGASGHSGRQKRAHFISSIVNKGREFEDLLTHDIATQLLSHMLGEQWHLSTGFAKILKPGAMAEALHTDQWWSAPPQRLTQAGHPSQPPIRSGSITRELAYTTPWHSGANCNQEEEGKVMYIPPCLANQALFLLSDFTKGNGATLLVSAAPGLQCVGVGLFSSRATHCGGVLQLCAAGPWQSHLRKASNQARG